MRVAGAQIPITTDIEANVTAISRAIDFAHDEKAEVLLTPEGSLSGYTHQFDAQHVENALRRITTKAQEAKVGLALGTCFVETDDQRCYNEIRFYDPDGKYLGFHSKILRTGSLTHPSEGEVTYFAGRPLTTFTYSDITVGGLICNDLWANPKCTPMPDSHLTQQLSERGTRIIFHAVYTGLNREWSDVEWHFHESNLQMRALAGQLWIVTVDTFEPRIGRSCAPSGVVDPQGNWVCQTVPTGPDYFAYTIPL